jgi:hypothetical protein
VVASVAVSAAGALLLAWRRRSIAVPAAV